MIYSFLFCSSSPGNNRGGGWDGMGWRGEQEKDRCWGKLLLFFLLPFVLVGRRHVVMSSCRHVVSSPLVVCDDDDC